MILNHKNKQFKIIFLSVTNKWVSDAWKATKVSLYQK